LGVDTGVECDLFEDPDWESLLSNTKADYEMNRHLHVFQKTIENGQ
jgi:hypothetical protein